MMVRLELLTPASVLIATGNEAEAGLLVKLHEAKLLLSVEEGSIVNPPVHTPSEMVKFIPGTNPLPMINSGAYCRPHALLDSVSTGQLDNPKLRTEVQFNCCRATMVGNGANSMVVGERLLFPMADSTTSWREAVSGEISLMMQ